ncbi:MAG: hypothetical protein E6G45_14080 [Actinobacteria bacterium]|nr:MAG: hypothetical protein E6G45_14080 [Actinomycetota bacterium]
MTEPESSGEALRGLSREKAQDLYRRFDLPKTSEEHWRFTDLKGFDPAAYDANVEASGGRAESMLEIDAVGTAFASESGIEIDAPDGVVFEPLGENELVGELVGVTDKLSAHNAAMWKHGLLVRVPRGVELEKPLYVRVTNTVEHGALFWRLVVVADEASRFTLIEEYTSDSPELDAYTNAAVELFVGQAAKLEYVSIQNLSRQTWHFASHHARVDRDGELDWVAGGFGSKRGKTWIQNDLAGPGATSRVTGAYFADGDQHLDYDTFQDACAIARRPSGAG